MYGVALATAAGMVCDGCREEATLSLFVQREHRAIVTLVRYVAGATTAGGEAARVHDALWREGLRERGWWWSTTDVAGAANTSMLVGGGCGRVGFFDL